MISDSEFALLMSDQEVLEAIMQLKAEFLMKKRDFAHLGNDDFVSLVMMAPSIAVALSNGTMSLYEELTLRRKARRLSRGSYFLREDPIDGPLRYIVEHFDEWRDKFYPLIGLMLENILRSNPVILEALRNPDSTTNNFAKDVMNAPYIFVKFIAFLFMDEIDDLINSRGISKPELEEIKLIGQKLEIDQVPLFQRFCETFEVRE